MTAPDPPPIPRKSSQRAKIQGSENGQERNSVSTIDTFETAIQNNSSSSLSSSSPRVSRPSSTQSFIQSCVSTVLGLPGTSYSPVPSTSAMGLEDLQREGISEREYGLGSTRYDSPLQSGKSEAFLPFPEGMASPPIVISRPQTPDREGSIPIPNTTNATNARREGVLAYIPPLDMNLTSTILHQFLPTPAPAGDLDPNSARMILQSQREPLMGNDRERPHSRANSLHSQKSEKSQRSARSQISWGALGMHKKSMDSSASVAVGIGASRSSLGSTSTLQVEFLENDPDPFAREVPRSRTTSTLVGHGEQHAYGHRDSWDAFEGRDGKDIDLKRVISMKEYIVPAEKGWWTFGFGGSKKARQARPISVGLEERRLNALEQGDNRRSNRNCCFRLYGKKQFALLTSMTIQCMAVCGCLTVIYVLISKNRDSVNTSSTELISDPRIQVIINSMSLFFVAIIFEFYLAIEAIITQNSFQVLVLIPLQAGLSVYAGFFPRRLEETLSAVFFNAHLSHVAKILAIIVLSCVVSMTIIISCFAWMLKEQFGLADLKSADRVINKLYHRYQAFLCLLKFSLLIFLIFEVQYLTNINPIHKFERISTIVAAPFVVLWAILAGVSARYESKPGMMVFAIFWLLGIIYFIWKFLSIWLSNVFTYNRIPLLTFCSLSIIVLVASGGSGLSVFGAFGLGLKPKIPSYWSLNQTDPDAKMTIE